MVREAERVIDGQLKAIEELDDKGENMIRLAVLGAILGLTMGSLTASNFHDKGVLAIWAIAIIGAGVVAALASLYVLVHSYASLGGERNAGGNPDVTDLPRRHRTKNMDLEIHFDGLLDGYAEAFQKNVCLMKTMTWWRRAGTKVLAYGAIPLYMAGMVLVVVLTFN